MYKPAKAPYHAILHNVKSLNDASTHRIPDETNTQTPEVYRYTTARINKVKITRMTILQYSEINENSKRKAKKKINEMNWNAMKEEKSKIEIEKKKYLSYISKVNSSE